MPFDSLHYSYLFSLTVYIYTRMTTSLSSEVQNNMDGQTDKVSYRADIKLSYKEREYLNKSRFSRLREFIEHIYAILFPVKLLINILKIFLQFSMKE